MPTYDLPPRCAPATSTDQVARQLILRAPDSRTFEILQKDPGRLGVPTPIFGPPSSLLMLVEAPSAPAVADVIALLRQKRNEPFVAAIERNRVLRAAAVVPNDPLYPDEWALQTIGAEAAWDRAATFSLSPVRVAIVDSGIQKDHPDLKAHYLGGTGSGADADEFGHGTLLAGTIGAVTGNLMGVAGVFGPLTVPTTTPAIGLISAKFFAADHLLTSYNAAIAVYAAVGTGSLDVINASWDVGMPLDNLGTGIPYDSLADAVGYAAANNVVFVAAAGNDGTDNDVLPTYPACYDSANVISVMATNEDDVRPAFSNYGAGSVHLAAPGTKIMTTCPYDIRLTSGATLYRSYSGTSAAAAHVTGAVAVLRALKPGWAANQIRDHLVASADPRPYLSCVARGRLNLKRAVQGPLSVTIPRAGARWKKNRLETVEWRSDYMTPAVSTVEISLYDSGGKSVLASGVSNDGSYRVRAPNRVIASAYARVASEQAPFMYADSALFKVDP